MNFTLTLKIIDNSFIRYIGMDSVMKNVNQMSSQAFIQKTCFISVVAATETVGCCNISVLYAIKPWKRNQLSPLWVVQLFEMLGLLIDPGVQDQPGQHRPWGWGQQQNS